MANSFNDTGGQRFLKKTAVSGNTRTNSMEPRTNIIESGSAVSGGFAMNSRSSVRRESPMGMPSSLDTVRTTIMLAGKELDYKYLKIKQIFNDHHTFEIHCHYSNFGKLWMEEPIDQINLIGEEVTIVSKTIQTNYENSFLGIITGVRFSGEEGTEGMVILTGASETIKLAGFPGFDSFVDLPLINIVQEIVANSGNGGINLIINPQFKSKLDYVCQYNLSAWDQLRLLAWETGEWLFSDGVNCYFGRHFSDTVDLQYDREMTTFDLEAKAAG